MPIEIGILGHSCDAVKPGNLLKTALKNFPSSVLITSDFARFLPALLARNLETREIEVSTLPWTQTEKDIALARCRNGQRAWRKEKPVLSLSAVTDEEGHLLKMRMNLEEDFVTTGEPFSRHSRKARGLTNTKILCDLFNKLLMTSVGLLIRLNLMNSLL